MAVELRKAVTDAGYVAVGVGVLAFQQAQVRRRDLQKRLGEAGGCLNARALDGKTRLDALQNRVGTLQQTVGDRAQDLRDRLETGARSANDWAQELGGQVKDRIEPVVGQVVEQVGGRVKTAVNRAA
jgi:hypothetical protein